MQQIENNFLCFNLIADESLRMLAPHLAINTQDINAEDNYKREFEQIASKEYEKTKKTSFAVLFNPSNKSIKCKELHLPLDSWTTKRLVMSQLEVLTHEGMSNQDLTNTVTDLVIEKLQENKTAIVHNNQDHYIGDQHTLEMLSKAHTNIKNEQQLTELFIYASPGDYIFRMSGHHESTYAISFVDKKDGKIKHKHMWSQSYNRPLRLPEIAKKIKDLIKDGHIETFQPSEPKEVRMRKIKSARS